MSAHGLRRWAAGLVLAGLPLMGAWFGAPTAEAAYHDGPCTDPSGVTVVVDHQELGGGVVVRCAMDFPTSGGTGLLALQLAGLTPTGTVKDGAAFVCRINNRPAADEDLTVGGQNYRESCIATPPATAFWSYWHASAGGGWTFSQLGASRSVQPGGYEGWSFSLNRSEGNNPAPGFKPAALPEPEPAPKPSTAAPVQPAAPATTARTSAAPPPAATTAAPTSAGTTASTAQSHTVRPTAPRTSAASPKASATPSASASPTAGPASASVTPEPTPTDAASPTPTATSSTQQSATTAAASSEPVTAMAPDAGAGSAPGIGTFVGLGAVAGIAAAGGVVWWRRRSLA